MPSRMTGEFELANYNREDFVYSKERLLRKEIKEQYMETLFFAIVRCVAIVSGDPGDHLPEPDQQRPVTDPDFLLSGDLYVMLDAPFMAAVQVMVYAGAIMVLIVFAIMLLNIRVNASKSQSHKVLLGSVIGFFTAAQHGRYRVQESAWPCPMAR